MAKGLNSSVGKRLQTFLRCPLPDEVELGVSALKLAEAGFVRPERCISDEVECSSCTVKYSGWSRESPIAIHRILNPNCPFLNTPPVTNDEKSRLRNELEKVTKKQFPTSESSACTLFSIPDVEQPFTPKNGDYLMLFESHRQMTFKNPLSHDAAVYAEAGFVYNVASKSVFCVFCNGELDFQPTTLSHLEDVHTQKFPFCPFVNFFDVGNITVEMERKIKGKVRKQHLRNMNKFNDEKVKFLIKNPEFEDEAARLGTFSSWPPMLTFAFPAEAMANSGFYYTGFNDKVKCYSCGVGLYNWPSGAIPAEQHAKASPHCVFLLDTKGSNFVSNAQNIELLVETDYKESSSGSLATEQDTALSVTDCTSSQSLMPGKTNSASSEECESADTTPGLPVLDMESIKAAMACGRYPNKDLLVGTLKATDENYLKLCEKSQEIIHTKAELEVKRAENAVFQAEKALFQAKEAQFQVREAQFEIEKTAYQQEIQAKNRELQRDLIIQHHREVLEQKDQILKEKDQMLEQKDQKIEQTHVELEMKNKELEDLQRHIRSLQAALESRQRSQGRGGEESILPLERIYPDSAAEEFPVASCKVCLVKRSEIMFRPCNHLCCCNTCASRLLLQGKTCPICRETNLGYEKVYVI